MLDYGELILHCFYIYGDILLCGRSCLLLVVILLSLVCLFQQLQECFCEGITIFCVGRGFNTTPEIVSNNTSGLTSLMFDVSYTSSNFSLSSSIYHYYLQQTTNLNVQPYFCSCYHFIKLRNLARTLGGDWSGEATLNSSTYTVLHANTS